MPGIGKKGIAGNINNLVLQGKGLDLPTKKGRLESLPSPDVGSLRSFTTTILAASILSDNFPGQGNSFYPVLRSVSLLSFKQLSLSSCLTDLFRIMLKQRYGDCRLEINNEGHPKS